MSQSPVYRQLALPVPVFDYIKQYQRSHEARTGKHLTINQTVSAIVLGYKQNEECEAHEQSKRTTALLQE